MKISEKKITVKIPTGVKLGGVELSEEFMQYKHTLDKLQRKFTTLFAEWVELDKVKGINGQYINFNQKMWDGKVADRQHPENEASLRHVRRLPEVKEIMASVFTEDEINNLYSSAVDDALWYVVERYKSFVNRNSSKKKKQFPKNGITLKSNKAMNFKDGKLRVSADKKTFTIKTLQKKKTIDLPFRESYYDNLHLVDKSWRGGNIVFNSVDKRSDNELVLRAEYEKELSLPKYIVGMDVNQKPENWVTFSEPMENGKVTLPKPDSVASIEKQRDDFNKKLRPSKRTVVEYKLNSGQRRRMYRRLQKKMVNRHTAIESEIIPILQYFKDKYNDEFGLAIDGVATGARSKSFGQEDIRDACVRWCIKNNVPFVIVPPQYTSQ